MSDNGGASAIIKYKNRFVFEIQKKHKWISEENGLVRIGIGCIGGVIEDGESPLETLFREVKEEISADINLIPINNPVFIDETYNVYELEPLIESNYLFFRRIGNYGFMVYTYLGECITEPVPNDLPGILLTDFETIFRAFDFDLTLSDFIKSDTELRKNIDIPMNAHVYPTGTVNILYKLYKNGDPFIKQLLY